MLHTHSFLSFMKNLVLKIYLYNIATYKLIFFIFYTFEFLNNFHMKGDIFEKSKTYENISNCWVNTRMRLYLE